MKKFLLFFGILFAFSFLLFGSIKVDALNAEESIARVDRMHTEKKIEERVEKINNQLSKLETNTITFEKYEQVINRQVKLSKEEVDSLNTNFSKTNLNKFEAVVGKIEFDNGIVELYGNGDSSLTIFESFDQNNDMLRVSSWKTRTVQATRYDYNIVGMKVLKHFLKGTWQYNGSSVKYVTSSASGYVKNLSAVTINKRSIMNYTLSNGTKGLSQYGMASTPQPFGTTWTFDLRIAVNKSGGYGASFDTNF